MNLQVGPKPYTPYRIPIDPFKGALKGTLITPHERLGDCEAEGLDSGSRISGSGR